MDMQTALRTLSQDLPYRLRPEQTTVLEQLGQDRHVVSLPTAYGKSECLTVFNPRPLRSKDYCRHLRLSVCLSVPIILVNTITQSVYPINPPNLLGGFNVALSWMVL